jgi:hypothetical protein
MRRQQASSGANGREWTTADRSGRVTQYRRHENGARGRGPSSRAVAGGGPCSLDRVMTVSASWLHRRGWPWGRGRRDPSCARRRSRQLNLAHGRGRCGGYNAAAPGPMPGWPDVIPRAAAGAVWRRCFAEKTIAVNVLRSQHEARSPRTRLDCAGSLSLSRSPP